MSIYMQVAVSLVVGLSQRRQTSSAASRSRRDDAASNYVLVMFYQRCMAACLRRNGFEWV